MQPKEFDEPIMFLFGTQGPFVAIRPGQRVSVRVKGVERGLIVPDRMPVEVGKKIHMQLVDGLGESCGTANCETC